MAADDRAFGDSGRYTEVLPTSITSGSTEVGGILLCLSCHDGNVTASNMMTGKSYEQSIGLLTNTAYGSAPIPTLLGNDGTTAGNYTNDHPVGVNCQHRAGLALTAAWPGLERDGFQRYRWQPLCPVRSQLRMARTGARKVFFALRRKHRWEALRALHHLPQPARDDGLHLEHQQPDRGRRRRQILRHLFLRERPLQSERLLRPTPRPRRTNRRPNSAVSATLAKQTKPTTPTPLRLQFQ